MIQALIIDSLCPWGTPPRSWASCSFLDFWRIFPKNALPTTLRSKTANQMDYHFLLASIATYLLLSSQNFSFVFSTIPSPGQPPGKGAESCLVYSYWLEVNTPTHHVHSFRCCLL